MMAQVTNGKMKRDFDENLESLAGRSAGRVSDPFHRVTTNDASSSTASLHLSTAPFSVRFIRLMGLPRRLATSPDSATSWHQLWHAQNRPHAE